MKKTTEKEKIVIDIDGTIKEAIDALFDDFMDMFFPDMVPLVDLSVKPIAIEQEFQGILSFASGKKKIVDKLYQLTMKPVFKKGRNNHKGEKKATSKPLRELILLHTEAETSPKRFFVRRMFLYAAIAIAKHGKPITALVIYTGRKVPKVPDFFKMSCFKTELTYAFRYYAVAEQKEEDLLASENVFALVILAIKYVIDSPNDFAKRFAFKKKLFSLLVERDIPLDKRRKLLIFVNEILRIPQTLQNDFVEFTENKISDNMKIKEHNMSVKERLKRSAREVDEFLAYALYGESIEVVMEKKMADAVEKKLADAVKKEVDAAVKKEVDAAVKKEVDAAVKKEVDAVADVVADAMKKEADAMKKIETIVLHLYHDMGFSYSQISKTADLSIDEVKSIISKSNDD